MESSLIKIEKKKKRNEKNAFYIYLYHFVHIALKHIGKQGKFLGCKVPRKVVIIGFSV